MDRSALASLLLEHGSFAAASRAVGIPPSTLRSAASRLKVRSRARGSRSLHPEVFDPAAARLLERGWKQAEVARRYGVTRQAVQRKAARLAAGLEAERAAALAWWFSLGPATPA